MRRTKTLASATALLLLLAPGCATVSLWSAVSRGRGSLNATRVVAARASETTLEVSLLSPTPSTYTVAIDYFMGSLNPPLFLPAPREGRLPTSSPALDLRVARARDLGASAKSEERPTLYWHPGSGSDLRLCLRGRGTPRFAVVSHGSQTPSFVLGGGLLIAGGVVASPVSVALDLATLPAQAVAILLRAWS